MALWIILPISLSLVSFIGTWSVYGLARFNNHVCSLSDWEGESFCRGNRSSSCCLPPTISASGSRVPENSLFSATINAGSFLFLLFSIFHHAHVLEKHACHSMLSRFGLAFGVAAAVGAFVAGNCNAGYLPLIHHLGAAFSFICICIYSAILAALTRLCVLSGYERILHPLRVVSALLQIIITICHIVLFVQDDYIYRLLSAVFEWMLSVNLQLLELSFVVEFCFFSSFMLANIFGKQEDQKPLMLTMS